MKSNALEPRRLWKRQRQRQRPSAVQRGAFFSGQRPAQCRGRRFQLPESPTIPSEADDSPPALCFAHAIPRFTPPRLPFVSHVLTSPPTRDTFCPCARRSAGSAGRSPRSSRSGSSSSWASRNRCIRVRSMPREAPRRERTPRTAPLRRPITMAMRRAPAPAPARHRASGQPFRVRRSSPTPCRCRTPQGGCSRGGFERDRARRSSSRSRTGPRVSLGPRSA